jgi:hypothetical protein
MIDLTLEPRSRDRKALTAGLRQRLLGLDPDAIVRVRLSGTHSAWARQNLGASLLRELAPPTMNISLAMDRSVFARS